MRPKKVCSHLIECMDSIRISKEITEAFMEFIYPLLQIKI